MVTEFKNLTPHVVNILDMNGNPVVSVPSSGLARCATTTVKVGEVAGVPIVETTFGKVENLPEPEEGVGYIVSLLVRQAQPDRKDLYSPGDLVRGADGQPVGCKGLQANL